MVVCVPTQKKRLLSFFSSKIQGLVKSSLCDISFLFFLHFWKAMEINKYTELQGSLLLIIFLESVNETGLSFSRGQLNSWMCYMY